MPISPPAFLMCEAPASIPGAPQPMWIRPSTPRLSAPRPMTMRPLASGRSGWRISRTAIPPSSIGTSTDSRPKAPLTILVTATASQPCGSDQEPAAISSASAISSSASPSLRCAGCRPLAPSPTPRAIAPTPCAIPSQVPRTAR